MNAEQITNLSDSELSRHATEVRQQCEAIAPYFTRELRELRSLLRAEINRRTTNDQKP